MKKDWFFLKDLNIARRDYEKTKESEGKDPSKDEENYEQVRVLGERADAIYNEVEHQRDGVITKIYSLTGKEQEIAKVSLFYFTFIFVIFRILLQLVNTIFYSLPVIISRKQSTSFISRQKNSQPN